MLIKSLFVTFNSNNNKYYNFKFWSSSVISIDFLTFFLQMLLLQMSN